MQGSPAFNRPPPTRVIKAGAETLPKKGAPAPKPPPASPLAATIAAVRAKNPEPVTEYRAKAEGEWKPPEILRTSIAGRRPLRDPEAIVPVIASPEPPAPVELHEMRTRGTTLTGLFGASASVVALLTLVLHNLVPWITVDPAEVVGPNPAYTLSAGALDRGALEAMTADSLYAARLLDWPLAGLIWVFLFGAALLGVDEIPRMRADRHRTIQTGLLGALAFAGVLLVLDASRWVGLYVASALDDGPSPIHLHIFPYIVLLVGGAVLAGSGYFLARKVRHLLVSSGAGPELDDVRRPLWAALAATLGLLALPLLPLVVLSTDLGTAYVNEAELEGARAATFDLASAASDYKTARGLLWVAFYLGWTAFALAVAERVTQHRALRPAYVGVHALLGLPLLGAAIFSLLFQIDLLNVDNAGYSVPLLLPATVVALGVLYVRFVRATFVPFLRHATLNLAE